MEMMKSFQKNEMSHIQQSEKRLNKIEEMKESSSLYISLNNDQKNLSSSNNISL